MEQSNWETKVAQQWEHQFLFYDCFELFATDGAAKSKIVQCRDMAFDEFIDSWHILHSVTHVFDENTYNNYVQDLEDKVFLTSDTPVTRQKLNEFRSRALKHKVCLIDLDGNVRLNQSFYYGKRWERDISGWNMLESNCDDPSIKAWFRRFKERATKYHTEYLDELNGGVCVEYDFSFCRKGPFPDVTD
jgi:hypothetical protein